MDGWVFNSRPDFSWGGAVHSGVTARTRIVDAHYRRSTRAVVVSVASHRQFRRVPGLGMVREEFGNATLIPLRGSFDLPQAVQLCGTLPQPQTARILDFWPGHHLAGHALGVGG